MNKAVGIIACLIPRIYSLSHASSERISLLDMIYVVSSMAVLLVLDNTRLMISFHFIMIVMYILSCIISTKIEWVFLNMLPIYIAFVLIENILILLPKAILAFVTVMIKYIYNGTLPQYNYLLLWKELSIYLAPFLIVGFLTSKKSPKKENNRIHYLGLLAMSFFLVSGNGFDYLFDNNSIAGLFIPKVYSFILWLFSFIQIGKLLGQSADLGIVLLKRLLSNDNIFLMLVSSIHSFVRPVFDSINANTLAQCLAIYFIQCIGCFFLKYAYNCRSVREKLIRLFIPTYGQKSSELTVRYGQNIK